MYLYKKMKNFCIYILLFVNMYAGMIDRYEQKGDIDDQDYRHCVYVPYWECKGDFMGLIDEEPDIPDLRDTVDLRIVDENSDVVPFADPAADLNVCCLLECGKRRKSIPSGVLVKRNVHEDFGIRVLGKTEAEFGEFPWMLGILQGRNYRCGASLIHPQVALTAAHCVTGKGPFTIRAGEWNWESIEELFPHQDRKPIQIVIHPNFHSSSLRNDIALIILETPFYLMQNVGVICLPRHGTIFDNENCVAAGWGKNSHKKGTYQSKLKKVYLPIVSRNRCLILLQNAALGRYYMLHQSFICAGGGAEKDTCKGDGGSPLMCPVKGRPGKYQQVGIVSWGLTCGKYDTPGVYVNLPMFRDWIDFIMSSYGFDDAVDKYGKRSWM